MKFRPTHTPEQWGQKIFSGLRQINWWCWMLLLLSTVHWESTFEQEIPNHTWSPELKTTRTRELASAVNREISWLPSLKCLETHFISALCCAYTCCKRVICRRGSGIPTYLCCGFFPPRPEPCSIMFVLMLRQSAIRKWAFKVPVITKKHAKKYSLSNSQTVFL